MATYNSSSTEAELIEDECVQPCINYKCVGVTCDTFIKGHSKRGKVCESLTSELDNPYNSHVVALVLEFLSLVHCNVALLLDKMAGLTKLWSGYPQSSST